MSDPKTALPNTTLHTQLDAYLACPTAPALEELRTALAAYQTEWIRGHAGVSAAAPGPTAAAAPAPAPRPAAVAKPRFPIAAADLEVLGRIADGWAATTAEVPRWAWFENRELVTLEPDPAGAGPELLRLAPLGWAAVGRTPPG